MNIYDDEIESFERTFSLFKTRKKVLYGTGRKTAVLKDAFNRLNIIGLTDRNVYNSGGEKYGLPLLTRDTVESAADMLVINTAKGYWTTIYNRIKDWNIPIFFLDGTQAKANKSVDTSDPYWNLDSEKLLAEIDRHGTIFFDIFDTLLARKVYFPGDVFELLDVDAIGVKRGSKKRFVEARKKAGASQDEPSLTRIYEKLVESNVLTSQDVAKAELLEKETDRRLLIPRLEMVRICNVAMQSHKVYFVSDMYYTSEYLLTLLNAIGIPARKEQIVVSCEYGKSKRRGGLWKLVRERFICEDRPSLHIGDDELADGIIPTQEGIDTFLIKSCRELAEKSSLKTEHVNIDGIDSSIVMGFLTSRLFNNPFRLSTHRGIVCFSTPEETGFYLLGGIAYSFAKWLHKACKKDGVRKLCFVGRDGFLLKPEFERYLALVSDESISTSYFDASRILLWNINIKSESDITNALRAMPFSGTYRKLFKTRLNIEITGKNAELEYVDDSQELDRFIQQYKEQILRNSSEQRRRYIKYLENVFSTEDAAIVDISYYGSIQFYIGKLLGKEIPGYYMTACMKESNPYFHKQYMRGCFGNDAKQGDTSNVLKRSTFIESFYTSPFGCACSIDENGTVNRLPEMKNQKCFSIREKMQDGILQCMDELHGLENTLGIDLSFPTLWNSVFEMFMDSGFEPSERDKLSFYREDVASTTTEYQIWE